MVCIQELTADQDNAMDSSVSSLDALPRKTEENAMQIVPYTLSQNTVVYIQPSKSTRLKAGTDVPEGCNRTHSARELVAARLLPQDRVQPAPDLIEAPRFAGEKPPFRGRLASRRKLPGSVHKGAPVGVEFANVYQHLHQSHVTYMDPEHQKESAMHYLVYSVRTNLKTFFKTHILVDKACSSRYGFKVSFRYDKQQCRVVIRLVPHTIRSHPGGTQASVFHCQQLYRALISYISDVSTAPVKPLDLAVQHHHCDEIKWSIYVYSVPLPY